MHLDRKTERFQFADDIDHARVTCIRHVLLEGQAEDSHNTTTAFPAQQPSNAFPSNALAYAIVDTAAGQDDFRMVTRLFRPIGQIVGVDSNAVATDQAWLKGQEIPFRAG